MVDLFQLDDLLESEEYLKMWVGSSLVGRRIFPLNLMNQMARVVVVPEVRELRERKSKDSVWADSWTTRLPKYQLCFSKISNFYSLIVKRHRTSCGNTSC